MPAENISSPNRANDHRPIVGALICFTIALLLLLTLGWKGILSGICLSIAGLLLAFDETAMGVTVILTLGICQFLNPALDGARSSILRGECQSNIREITLAIHDYQDDHGILPPICSRDKDRKPLHSWRVLLLPYLNENELYQRIDHSKPWDHPSNLPLHDLMPAIFECPSLNYHSKWGSIGKHTNYVACSDLPPWN